MHPASFHQAISATNGAIAGTGITTAVATITRNIGVVVTAGTVTGMMAAGAGTVGLAGTAGIIGTIGISGEN